MKKQIYNHQYAYFFVLFILIETILVSALTYHKNSKISSIESRFIQRLSTQIKSVIEFYSTTSTIITNEIINDDRIQPLLVNMNSNNQNIQNQIRQELYSSLLPTYDRLTNHGFRQLHFHDISGNSFLRFHSPDNYGDNLFNFRATILATNKTQKPHFGFEEGKILNGFRNVFPIIINSEFYGTVELSNSFDTFSETLHKNFPYEFKLLITKEYVNSKVFEELIPKYYRPSTISEMFYEENSIKNYKFQRFISANKLKIIDQKLFGTLDEKLLNKKTFVKSLQLNKKNYIVTFLPVSDFDKSINTYIISYIEDNSIFDEQNWYYVMLFFSNVMIAIFIMFYILKHYLDEKNKFMEKAYKDTLTKLYNRNKFNYDMNKILLDDKNDYLYSLIIFDIDHFKYINDTFGHDVGDSVLEELANVLKVTLRENDMIYRWGGEEFIVLVNDHSTEHLELIANKLRVAIELHKFKHIKHITCSFGVAIATKEDTKETLLKKADLNLYKAKQSGRNCVVID